nr:unnamed protein product [Spirometra erinaceieuropaei]
MLERLERGCEKQDDKNSDISHSAGETGAERYQSQYSGASIVVEGAATCTHVILVRKSRKSMQSLVPS